jgi:hypothetical protein
MGLSDYFRVADHPGVITEWLESKVKYAHLYA